MASSNQAKKNYNFRVSAIVATIIAVILLGISFFQFVKIDDLNSQVSSLETQVTSLQVAAKESNIRENGVSYEGKNDKIALELLKDSYKVETKDYSGMGEFVVSIDGVKAEDGKNFWAFYVDDQMAAEGAGTYKTKDGEKIEWRLDEIQ